MITISPKWTVQRKTAQENQRNTKNERVANRYGLIFLEWMKVVGEYDVISNKDYTSWLYTKNVYIEPNGLAFEWDFAERLQLESVAGSELEEEEGPKIINFWDWCMPIALCVSGDYEFWGLTKDGKYVYGCLADGNDSNVIWDSPGIFLDHLEKRCLAGE